MADLDWVRARADCSLHKVFERLVSGVKDDVASRQELARELDQGIHFAVTEDHERRLLVTRNLRGTVSTVEFILGPSEIVVEEDGLQTLTATAGLNEKGECTLQVEGTEWEPWQVRRMALEGLFFRLPPPVTMRSR
jgi:hypothetical protein